MILRSLGIGYLLTEFGLVLIVSDFRYMENPIISLLVNISTLLTHGGYIPNWHQSRVQDLLPQCLGLLTCGATALTDSNGYRLPLVCLL